jgi:hypothetical protein
MGPECSWCGGRVIVVATVRTGENTSEDAIPIGKIHVGLCAMSANGSAVCWEIVIGWRAITTSP